MNCIVNVTSDWGIGNENSLLVRIPDDMKWFREHTIGKVVIMGRKTLESFPGGRPLKGRINIVITRDEGYVPLYLRNEQEPVNDADLIIVHDTREAALAARQRAEREEDIYVIGGASVYRQLLPYTDRAYVTRVRRSLPADSFFPNIEEDGGWELESASELFTYEGTDYDFAVYARRKDD